MDITEITYPINLDRYSIAIYTIEETTFMNYEQDWLQARGGNIQDIKIKAVVIDFYSCTTVFFFSPVKVIFFEKNLL